MNIHRLLYSKYSSIIISIILGLGLAALFKPEIINSPNLDELLNNTWRDGNQCYTLEVDSNNGDTYKKCDADKNIINVPE